VDPDGLLCAAGSALAHRWGCQQAAGHSLKYVEPKLWGVRTGPAHVLVLNPANTPVRSSHDDLSVCDARTMQVGVGPLLD
jgi:hypothetical protein